MCYTSILNSNVIIKSIIDPDDNFFEVLLGMNFDEIFQAKASFEQYFMEKCYSQNHQQLSFKYFIQSFLIQKLLSKVS